MGGWPAGQLGQLDPGYEIGLLRAEESLSGLGGLRLCKPLHERRDVARLNLPLHHTQQVLLERRHALGEA
jgi:hypothetical protein